MQKQHVGLFKDSFKQINPLAPTPKNRQTYSSLSSANYQRIVGVCLTIFWDLCLNG